MLIYGIAARVTEAMIGEPHAHYWSIYERSRARTTNTQTGPSGSERLTNEMMKSQSLTRVKANEQEKHQ